MAYNTPAPQRAVRSTTAALASKTGAAGEVIFDIDKKTLVGMDGTTPGGNPVALEKRKIKSASDSLTVNGGAEADLSADITLALTGSGESSIWDKRIEGSVPTDDDTLQEQLADVPHGGLVYYTEGLPVVAPGESDVGAAYQLAAEAKALAEANQAKNVEQDGRITTLEGTSGGTTTFVVKAPEYTLPNFVAGETASITFTSASLLVDGSIASIHVEISALSVNEVLPATGNSATLSVTVPSATAVGTEIVVNAWAEDTLGNLSEVATKTAATKAKAIATPTITVSGQEDIWAAGLTVTPSEFSMQIGTDTLAGATVTIRNAADTSTFATKEFTGAGPYAVPASELTNIYGGGAFKVKMVYTSTGGLTSPEAVADVTVTGAAITTPSLTSPVANAEILKTGSLIMTSSAFAKTPANAPIVHSLTDWKVTSDAAGNVSVLEALNSTDLTSHTFADLSSLVDNTTYYCWVRYHGTI